MSGCILVVDDSLTVRADLMDAFAAEGLQSVGCATLGQAREVLSSQPVSLVVLDLLLPDGDGVDLLAEIRTAPRAAPMPVLMLSSEAEVRDRIRGLALGSSATWASPTTAPTSWPVCASCWPSGARSRRRQEPRCS